VTAIEPHDHRSFDVVGSGAAGLITTAVGADCGRQGDPASQQAPSTLPAWLIVVMVAAIGLNLRASLGSIPPLLEEISGDLDLSGAMQGLLTSVAVVFMGFFAPLGQRIAARFGAEVTTAMLLALLSIGGLMRLGASSTAVLLTSAGVAGAAMGGASALMPGLIAHHLPRIRGLTTGIYSTGLALGVAVAAWVAVPSSAWLGGWRPALAIWGFFAAATAAAWTALLPRLRNSAGAMSAQLDVAGVSHRLPWRSPTARWVTAFTTSQMIIGIGGLAWIAPLYVDLGLPTQSAANLFVVFQVVQLVAMMSLATITDYTRDRRPLLALVLMATCLGVGGLVVAPLALAVPAVTLFGLGAGGGLTLALILIVDSTSSQPDAARLGAMTFFVAFLAGALGPFVLGLLRDLTGGFTAGCAVLLTVGLVTLCAVPVFRPDRKLEDSATSNR